MHPFVLDFFAVFLYLAYVVTTAFDFVTRNHDFLAEIEKEDFREILKKLNQSAKRLKILDEVFDQADEVVKKISAPLMAGEAVACFVLFDPVIRLLGRYRQILGERKFDRLVSNYIEAHFAIREACPPKLKSKLRFVLADDGLWDAKASRCGFLPRRRTTDGNCLRAFDLFLSGVKKVEIARQLYPTISIGAAKVRVDSDIKRARFAIGIEEEIKDFDEHGKTCSQCRNAGRAGRAEDFCLKMKRYINRDVRNSLRELLSDKIG